MRGLRGELTTGICIIGASAAMLACNSDSDSRPPAPACQTTRSQVMTQFAMSPSVAVDNGSRHIPAAVRNFADRGRLDDEQELPVTIALSLNNEEELNQRLADVYQPGSPNYHRFVTPEEFRSRYAPTQQQIDDVQAYLYSRGLQELKVNANGYLIQAKGKVSSLNDAFQTEIRQFQDRGGTSYFAPASEPRLPEGLSIRAIHGLNNTAQLKSFAHRAVNESSFENEVSPQMGSGPGGGLGPSDIRSAYSIPTSVNGSGQTLALVELDGYNSSDIVNYEQSFGLPRVSLQNVMIDGASGGAGQGAGEVTLDIELMIAVAPGASKILVYEAPNTSQGLLDLYSRIANDNSASVVSTSWGGPESMQSTSFLETENAIFKQMALQGQSFYAAAGDSGAYGDDSSLSVIDPASQPYSVAVGGTRLVTNRGSYSGETTWNGGSPSAGAGGGGVSSVWVQPGWQNGIASGRNSASSSMRNIPDVALNADPSTGYAIFVGGRWAMYGGTSAAAPLWAAFTALVNQQRQLNGLGRLGFPDPYLYAIGRGSNYGSSFHDIQDGSTNLYYPAVPGYDDATGWGSFNGQGLFEDLSTEPPISSAALSC